MAPRTAAERAPSRPSQPRSSLPSPRPSRSGTGPQHAYEDPDASDFAAATTGESAVPASPSSTTLSASWPFAARTATRLAGMFSSSFIFMQHEEEREREGLPLQKPQQKLSRLGRVHRSE